MGSDGAKQGMRIMNITPWKNWPESQRKRVLDEIALLVQTTITSFDKKSQVVRAALYELYPYAVANADYDHLVRDIVAHIDAEVEERKRKEDPLH